MNFWAKITIVFLCAAICALSVSLIPRAEQRQPRSIETTPVLLRDSNLARWLLV
jgi:lipopolysaccharide export LptBFGC system permease protein LptF